MAAPNSRRPSTHVRSFGAPEALSDDTNDTPGPSTARRILGKMSFSSLRRGRPSFLNIRSGGDTPSTPSTERAPIPTMMSASGEVYMTPLPKLSMIVLSITMLGEFLSANVSTPFLLFMVKGFGEFKDEAEVAFWTGILVSTFFLTQFLTSLLWATVAEKHGRRVVLMISLLGSAITCLIFGTATTLQQAICIRLLQGIFAGAVGVARGCVAFVTDPSNEGRAYAILGFCWGLGGVAGAIIGGSFERPATKWPETFGDVQLFKTYPYLLPCGLAASVTLLGSFLCLFLGRDGGPREGAIRLLPEKFTAHPPIPEEESRPQTPVFEDEDEPRGGLARIQRRISRRFSDYFAKRVPDAHQRSASPLLGQLPVPLSAAPNTRLDRTRTFSRTSKTNGSAYGYGGAYRSRLASNATLNARRGSLSSSLRHRRGSAAVNGRPDYTAETPSDLNFAQRLLLANENAVTNIADLWVAAAMNVDNEDPFESDAEDEEEDVQDEPLVGNGTEEGTEMNGTTTPIYRGSRGGAIPTPIARLSRTSHRPSNTNSLHPASPLRHTSPLPNRTNSVSFSPMIPSSPRRPSTSVPSIFAHPGVKAPTAVLDAQHLLLSTDVDNVVPSPDTLGVIAESRLAVPAEADVESLALTEKPPSLMSQLPIVVIIQYGVMALHTTTHDQIFMSYLVSDQNSGGLNLNAGHFAQLIALMCLFQIAYQFYLYPNIGPPRGRFSHLAMFRLGTIMFIPAYLSVIPYRRFANVHPDDSNPFIMFALSVSTAVRYCGTTFGYTAISILLNYMTPPNAVGYANGIAQSIVSLARCVGPVIGGYLWSLSVADGPSGYYFGFVVCAGVCALTVLQSFLIR
ncbi:major facilitator superfamily MFS-1 [Pholiota conissans]|uniref:Major facilitator superfamily MFS-1 n=1 Tax=Pholiota conissans TaxID=109636 RepID=A0A9P5YV23_9AGAR|nr:major facilitator superfamily MFS-1 [Pholiota conissans]